MNESRDAPPWEGGSGGLLEVVDMMCTVTETMAQIIRKQAEMIERTKMEEAVREELRAARGRGQAAGQNRIQTKEVMTE